MLQDKKTDFYKKIIEEVATSRPGVIELMDEAINDPRINVIILYCIFNIHIILRLESVLLLQKKDLLNLLIVLLVNKQLLL